MRILLRDIADAMAKNNAMWSVLNIALIPFFYRLTNARKALESEKNKKQENESKSARAKALFPELTVQNGPFRGMSYPSSQAYGSEIMPKLLGSYESELHPLIELFCQRHYKQVIDIGCAEGYYAVGLAMRIPSTVVYAFDINPDATAFCREMALLNGVNLRVKTCGLCSVDTLLSLPLTDSTLIISDCEGYEKLLFSNCTSKHLHRVDLLIEVHDCIDPSISREIIETFAASHEVSTITSISDAAKARDVKFKMLASHNDQERLSIVSEGRPCTMEWIYLESLINKRTDRK